jgi:hypothetical protein
LLTASTTTLEQLNPVSAPVGTLAGIVKKPLTVAVVLVAPASEDADPLNGHGPLRPVTGLMQVPVSGGAPTVCDGCWGAYWLCASSLESDTAQMVAIGTITALARDVAFNCMSKPPSPVRIDGKRPRVFDDGRKAPEPRVKL